MLLLLSLLLLVAMAVLEEKMVASVGAEGASKGGETVNALDAIMKEHLEDYKRMKGELDDIKTLATCVALSVDEGDALMKCNKAYLNKTDAPENPQKP